MGFCSVCGKEIEQAVGMCPDCMKINAGEEDYMDALLKSMSIPADDNTPEDSAGVVLVPEDNNDISEDVNAVLDEMLAINNETEDFSDELADLNLDDFDLNSLLESGDDVGVPSLDDMLNAEGIDELDALLAEEMQQEESNFEDTETEAVEEDLSEDGLIPDDILQELADDVSAGDLDDNSDIEDIEHDEIDLLSLLTGDDSEFETLLDDSPILSEDTASVAASNDYEEFSSVGNGTADILIDNDLLAVEGSGSTESHSIGDVFSDSLSALSSETDDGLDDEVNALLDNVRVNTKKKERKSLKEIFGKLFGNIVDEKEIEKAKQAKEDEAKSKARKEEEAVAKKEKAEADKVAKAAAKEQKAKEKEEKKQIKAAQKQAKKEEKELKELEEEAEIEGRINKVGTAIVFVVLGLMATFIFFGTRMFSYGNSIKNAQTYFDNGQYAESYKELLGVEIKDEEDEILYQKIVTVMYVYKQLEAYDVYYKESKYPEALDSLLKGIREYEKHIPDAMELDITSDLDSVKSQIVTELEAEFGITEDMAKEINQITDSTEYSRRVYDLAQYLIENDKRGLYDSNN